MAAGGGGGGGPIDKPWILVFDMDDTLIHEGYPGKLLLNVVRVLVQGISQRDSIVKYIFLLTNNQGRWDIETAINAIKRNVPEGSKIFDAIKYIKTYETNPTELTREDIQDIPTTAKRYYVEQSGKQLPTKDMNDIVDLMSLCGEDIDYTELFEKYKIMFFDDNRHWLSYNLEGTSPLLPRPVDTDQYRYVQVVPAKLQKFSKELELLGYVEPAAAGGSKTRKQKGGSRKKSKRTKKNKK